MLKYKRWITPFLTLGSHFEILGVVFYSKLSRKYHIDLLCSHLSSSVRIIYRCRNILSYKRPMTLYNSFIRPYLNYCYLIWRNAQQTSLSKTHTLQKRVLKIISSFDRRTSSDLVYNKTKVLTVSRTSCKQCLIFMCKSRNSLLPTSLCNIFTGQLGHRQLN